MMSITKGIRWTMLLLVVVHTAGSAIPAARGVPGPERQEQLGLGAIESLDAKRLIIDTAPYIALAFASPATGFLTLSIGLAWVMSVHGILFRTATAVNERILGAWAVESLLELNYQLRGVVRRTESVDYLAKLDEDERLLQERIREGERQVFLKASGPPAELEAARNAVALDQTRLQAIQKYKPRVAEQRADLKRQADAMLAAFDAVRRRVITGAVETVTPPAQGQGGSNQPPDETAAKKDPLNMGPSLVSMSRFNAQMWSETSEYTKTLVDYMTSAAKYEREMYQPVTVNTPVTINGQETSVPSVPTAMQQLRMVMSNDSETMLFLVKLHTKGDLKDDKGNIVERDAPVVATTGRRGWVPLYPKGAAIKISDGLKLGDPARQGGAPPGGAAAGSANQGKPAVADIVLPNTIWFPIKKGDRLEVRALTYGDLRQQIRWLSLRGRNVVPDFSSIRRSYYYVGWQTALVGQIRDSGVRRYSVQETYSWGPFSGPWGQEPQRVTTNPADIYEAPEWANDPTIQPVFMKKLEHTLAAIEHITWTMPENREQYEDLVEKLKLKPYLSVKVSGTSKFMYVVTAGSSNGLVSDSSESGDGTFTLKIEPW